MHLSDYLKAIALGLVIGVLGRLVLPGRQRVGAFVTLLVGIGAALLGAFVARLFNVDHKAEVGLVGLRWSWVVLAIQVALAVIGIGLANALTYTKLADRDAPARRRPRRRRTKAKARDSD